MSTIDRLNEIFQKFPGIGPRQANRFVHYLLRNSSALRHELSTLIEDLSSDVSQCRTCMRYHNDNNQICDICRNPRRDTGTLAIVANDQDLFALENSGYRGTYFVMGGTVHLGNQSVSNIRISTLRSIMRDNAPKYEEIILAFPANPEGDATADIIRTELRDIISPKCSISQLGRGLSTGSELEYADVETLKNALQNRK